MKSKKLLADSILVIALLASGASAFLIHGSGPKKLNLLAIADSQSKSALEHGDDAAEAQVVVSKWERYIELVEDGTTDSSTRWLLAYNLGLAEYNGLNALYTPKAELAKWTEFRDTKLQESKRLSKQASMTLAGLKTIQRSVWGYIAFICLSAAYVIMYITRRVSTRGTA